MTVSSVGLSPAKRHRGCRRLAGHGQNAFASAPREVKLAGSVLKINEYPIFPRCVEYHGERLAFLKQLGFNTVWLRQVPSPAFLAETRRLGLWLVCPPPEDCLTPGSAPSRPRQATIGPEFEPVLVWDLGHGLTGESLDANAAAGGTGAAGRCPPFAAADLRAGQQPAKLQPGIIDLLLIDRRPLGTSLEMPDYGTWVRRQPLLALPGTPVWTTVQTQAGEGLRRQFAALTPGQAPPTVVGPEQIRLLVYTAISSGSRGLLFLSDSSLEAQDGETRQRVMTLAIAEPGTRSHRALGGRRHHGRHGRVQPAAGQRARSSATIGRES